MLHAEEEAHPGASGIHARVQAGCRPTGATGKTLTAVAQNPGIARSLLQYWRKQLEDKSQEAFPGKGNVSGDAARIRELEKQLRDVREERDILRKTLAYFADDRK